MQCLAVVKLNLLDVGVTEHIQFVLFDPLPIGLADELAFDLLVDVLGVLLEDHGFGRLARPEAGHLGVADKILRDRHEGLIDCFGIDFEAHQLLARRQSFHRYIH